MSCIIRALCYEGCINHSHGNCTRSRGSSKYSKYADRAKRFLGEI
ncbi:hypothetical protein BLA24064_02099 [Burkholderia latens]|uniref:Uncharacterized protein n=1 Tax=Burkholderia latens TaxID=488446 RepID=A0A6P2JU41_9BURK|nr:hypothetical protein BLA24064_02099 [Burkholderia latens]